MSSAFFVICISVTFYSICLNNFFPKRQSWDSVVTPIAHHWHNQHQIDLPYTCVFFLHDKKLKNLNKPSAKNEISSTCYGNERSNKSVINWSQDIFGDPRKGKKKRACY